MKYIFLLLSVLFNISSYVLYRLIAKKEVSTLWVLLFSAGLILGAVNTFFFTRALKEITLNIAYPVFI